MDSLSNADLNKLSFNNNTNNNTNNNNIILDKDGHIIGVKSNIKKENDKNTDNRKNTVMGYF
jgi:hypothetical protein